MRLGLFLVGAFIGAPTRYLIDQYFRSYIKFPIGILIVNVLGTFLLGVVVTSQTNIAFALMGFCGALTTWSAFAISVYEVIWREDWILLLLALFSHTIAFATLVSISHKSLIFL